MVCAGIRGVGRGTNPAAIGPNFTLSPGKVHCLLMKSKFRSFVYIFKTSVYINKSSVYTFKSFVFTLFAEASDFMSGLMGLFPARGGSLLLTWRVFPGLLS